MHPTERLLIAVMLLWSVVVGAVLFLFGRVAVRVGSEWAELWRSSWRSLSSRVREWRYFRGAGCSMRQAWNLSGRK